MYGSIESKETPHVELVHETEPHSIERRELVKPRNDEFIAIRHSIAEYKLNTGIVESEHPEEAPDSDKQDFNSDLTEEGKRFARHEAEMFFDTLDAKTDALYFASSDLVRASETAMIYLEVATERGFEIVSPFKEPSSRDTYRNKAEEIGEGKIKRINALTLDHLSNMLREFVFHQDDYLKTVVKHPENVSQETLEKWPEARAIIESKDNNKGTWGKNYAAHSKEIEEIFPDVKSAETVHRQKFLRLMKLILFGARKINEANPEKNIKVLGFTHENSFLYFMNSEFGKSMGNCEAVRFRVTDDPENGEGAKKITATANDSTGNEKTVEVEDRYENRNQS